MKPRTSVEALCKALEELQAMAAGAKALDTGFRRGYLHAVGMMIRWCRNKPGTPVPEAVDRKLN